MGGVLAIKGLGGYHLAADATSDHATGTLRARKHREDKPFAVMVSSVDEARRFCAVDDAAAALLTDRRRPIVLLPAGRRDRSRRTDRARQPGCRHHAAVHADPPHALRALGKPIVLTSGNVSDEPIAYLDDDARTRLGGIADAYLTHDRPIHIRVDDSVARISRGRPMLLRRARGYAPEPMRLALTAPVPILACGAELKSTFCLVKVRSCGDVAAHRRSGELLDTALVRAGRRAPIPTVRHRAGHDRLRPAPGLSLHEICPGLRRRRIAADWSASSTITRTSPRAWPTTGVAGPVIGVAFDGTGYGPDGTIWGGEFLLADLNGRSPASAIWRPCHCPAARRRSGSRGGWRCPIWTPPTTARHRTSRYSAATPTPPPRSVTMGRRGINAPLTSSAGRLFDAVAAILGLRDEVTYEGQAAIDLEQCADRHETGAYSAGLDGGHGRRGRPGPSRGRRPIKRYAGRHDRGPIPQRAGGRDGADVC